MTTKRRRKHAEDRALEVLNEGRSVTDADLLEALNRWRFHKNKSRQNVLPEGEESVDRLHIPGGEQRTCAGEYVLGGAKWASGEHFAVGGLGPL